MRYLLSRQFSGIREHWLAVVAALAVGAIMILPQVLFIFQLGSRYQGINIFETDAEYYYISRIREVYDGHYAIANSILGIGKDLPYVQPPLGELMMGAIGRLLSIEIGSLLILFRFAAPAILFLLIYRLMLKLGVTKHAGIIGGLLVILGSNLISNPKDLMAMAQGTFGTQLFLDYARPINPQISSLFLFGFLNAFVSLHQSRKMFTAALAAFIYGLSFYVYPYTWTYLSVVIGLSALWAIVRRQWWLFFLLCTIGASGLIIALPYFMNTLAVLRHPSYEILHSHWGLLNSRAPVFSTTIVAGLLIAAAAAAVDKKWRSGSFILGLLLLAGAVAINQQVITGRELYYGHYHWYFIKPVFALCVAYFAFAVLSRFRWRIINAVAFTVGAAILFYNGVIVQHASYAFHVDTYKTLQRYRGVIDWLNSNTKNDEIVYVPGSFFFPVPGRDDIADYPSVTLGRFVTAYTPLNLYFSRYANFYLLPDPDYKTYNLYVALRLLGVAPDGFRTYVRENPDIFSDYYLAYFKERGQTFADVPDEWIDELERGYRELCSRSWDEVWQRYPVDYIVWDQGDLPNLPFYDINTGLDIYTEIYNQDGVVVLKFL